MDRSACWDGPDIYINRQTDRNREGQRGCCILLFKMRWGFADIIGCVVCSHGLFWYWSTCFLQCQPSSMHLSFNVALGITLVFLIQLQRL
ncbi:hypothetical protein BKA64DRAFT_651385, partial [Cadophora sp. MPI-SDFR-AT-0126]